MSSVRATSTGTYVVDVLKSDGTEVHVLLDAKFAVTSVEEGGLGGRPRRPAAVGGHAAHPRRWHRLEQPERRQRHEQHLDLTTGRPAEPPRGSPRLPQESL